jgi:tripartite-type tricarboxylate transporter receptor subunit TctC
MKTVQIERGWTGLIVAGAAFTIPVGAAQAAEFPTKPINMIVAYQAGGGTDVMARAMADRMSAVLGQPVLVQNKPGAGGGVAALYTASAGADGHTIVVSTSTTYTLEPHVQKVAYKNEDFTHIANIGMFQEAIFSKAGSPFKTLKEMIAYAKKGKRPLKYASLYQLDKLFTGYIAEREGIEIIPVPVRGGAGVMPAVLGGHVDFGWSGGSFAPHVLAKTIDLLAVMTYERQPAFPDAPAMKDLGYDVGTEVFITVSTSAKAPKSAVDKIAAALKEAQKEKVYIDAMTTRNQLIVFNGPSEMPALMKKQSDMYKKLATKMK